MDQFPRLSDPLDIYPIESTFFLSAFPHFLAFGNPSAANSNFYFHSNSYIKIFPLHYNSWFEAINEILTCFSVDSDARSGVVVEKKS